jgi:DnaK suppressor protein
LLLATKPPTGACRSAIFPRCSPTFAGVRPPLAPEVKVPMAKATKSSAKSSTKSKAPPPKKNGKTVSVKPKATAAAKTAAKIQLPKAPPPKVAVKPVEKEKLVGLKPTPDPSVIRSHPDAKLSKTELNSLYGKLVDEKSRVLGNFENRVDNALAEEDVLADEIDIAQRSTDQAWLFRMADKDRKLLIEIEAALEKMHSGEYGVCEGTDEPIGFKRLELRPWTRYSVGYKEMLEREKAQQAR